MCCIKKYFSFLLNSCILCNLFVVLGNLLYNFVPIFALLFLRSIILQNWVWRSDFWLRFAEQELCSLPMHTQCSLLKSGSQQSRKSEWLHHPTGHTTAVCRTFKMTYSWCNMSTLKMIHFAYFHATMEYDIFWGNPTNHKKSLPTTEKDS